MRRSWLRNKVNEGKSKMASKVSERARALMPMHQGATDSCMVCGRPMRPTQAVRGEGRVCSPACARQWAEGLA